jgi:hypothetical protein
VGGPQKAWGEVTKKRGGRVGSVGRGRVDGVGGGGEVGW